MIILYAAVCLAAAAVPVAISLMPKEGRNKIILCLRKDSVISDLGKISPEGRVSDRGTGFYIKKIRTAALITGIGTLLALAFEISEINSDRITDSYMIRRDDYMGNKREVKLIASSESGDLRDEVTACVSERRYSTEQLEDMAALADRELFGLVLSDNPSLDRICTDMYFPSSIEGYPFKISWRTDDPLLINGKGVIDHDRLSRIAEDKQTDVSEGVLTGIHAELKYEDFLHELDLTARIFPDTSGNELTFSGYLEEMIRREDEETREDEYLKLPAYVSGERITYTEAGDGRGFMIFLLTITAAAVMYFREDRELKKRVKDRDRELIRDYPELVNKFALFYGAGLNTRGVINKLCRDYRVHKKQGGAGRFLYEELLRCEDHMNEGMGETESYEILARSTGLRKYRRFVSLIEQSVDRGRSDILMRLEREAEDAFTERKNKARELGEEAGTKLLFPMLMMLAVVLMIVMMPAFLALRI